MGQGAASLLAMKTHDPSWNWSFLCWRKREQHVNQQITHHPLPDCHGNYHCNLYVCQTALLQMRYNAHHLIRRKGFLVFWWPSQDSMGSVCHLGHERVLSDLWVTHLLYPAHSIQSRVNGRN